MEMRLKRRGLGKVGGVVRNEASSYPSKPKLLKGPWMVVPGWGSP